MAVVIGTSNISLAFSQAINAGVLTNYNVPANMANLINIVNGTGAGKVDLMHAKQYSLAATPTTIDLTNLLDPNGGAVNFARVRLIAAFVQSTTATYTVVMSPGASNGFILFTGSTGLITVPAGYTYTDVSGNVSTIASKLFIEDWASIGANGYITSGTTKTLKFDPGANTVTMNLLILGCSAAS